MRFTKAENLLRLAIWFQSSYVGVGLQDIQEEFDVGRRTAERMRDAVSRLLPDLLEVQSEGTKKRWKIPKSKSLLPIKVQAEELAALDIARQILKRKALTDQAEHLREIERKLRTFDNGQRSTGREVDLEAMLEAEGLAMRLGPKPIIDADVLDALREAILKCVKVTLHYKSRGSDHIRRQRVCPYGFLYGKQHYLVAYSTNPKVKDYRLYRLDNIHRVTPLDEPYERREDFSLQHYAEQSFGIFQGEKYEVVLMFSERTATDANSFSFHPTQNMVVLEDGRLQITMHASGLRELAWHLLTWGSEVEIIKPERLKGMMNDLQKVMAKSRHWTEPDL
ncbi:MAG: WYL domain-containing protein [Alphaproteobacteria bacterium]|nr:MAG: WYL domain-containing protein [Alphaproteobacteria bacterium]